MNRRGAMKRLIGMAITAVCAIVVLLLTMAPDIEIEPPPP